MAVIDAITYHNEADLFDLRYNALKDVVDEFIVVEATSTFSGYPKDPHFPHIAHKYPKARYCLNEEGYTPEEVALAEGSPNTGGVKRWVLEFMQKERMQEAMRHLKDDDVVFIGDVDELWDPRLASEPFEGISKLKMRVYAYFLDLRSSEEFWGPIRCRYRDIRGRVLNHMRNNGPNNSKEYGGWHFTNMGGLRAVKKKLYDQYNPEVFNDTAHRLVEERFGKMDYVGRDFTLKQDTSDWPQFLKENHDKYKHLMKDHDQAKAD